MIIETSVAEREPTVAEHSAPKSQFPNPAAALDAAIAQFESQAAFHRALIARSKNKTLTKAAVSQWVRRKRGAPSDMAPDIEAISDVPCEAMCPDVSWEVLRKHVPPPVYSPRATK
jgi:hypothetical protein